MRLSIAEALDRIQNHQPHVPVVFMDTCSFLDLFRRDEKRSQPRVPSEEIFAASKLLDLLSGSPNTIHLVIPELIPKEYLDHADGIQTIMESWVGFHDLNQIWIAEVCPHFGIIPPTPLVVQPLKLVERLRALADNLLATAIVLERDQSCLDRAVHRLIHKIRPSHQKEMKDSMNLEQCLELSRQLRSIGFSRSRVWISSNTNDFAQTSSDTRLHADLKNDFDDTGLLYFINLRAAVGYLKANSEL